MAEFQAVLCVKDKPTFTMIQRIADAIQEKVIENSNHQIIITYMLFIMLDKNFV